MMRCQNFSIYLALFFITTNKGKRLKQRKRSFAVLKIMKKQTALYSFYLKCGLFLCCFF